MIARIPPEPTYYKGWAIWPSPNGFVACERTDTQFPDEPQFEYEEDAKRYIDNRIEQGRNGDR